MATSYYSTGTVSLTNGSAVVIGNGTAWQTNLITNGYLLVEAADGNVLPILKVDSNTQIIAEFEWQGETGSYSYALMRNPDQLQDNAENSKNLVALLNEIRNGLAFKYDASGLLADRALFDARPKGFAYLVIGGTTADLYVKRSNTSGDWAGPYAYGKGDKGDKGDGGPYTTITIGPTSTLPAGSPAQVVATPVNPTTVQISFALPKGVDGNGAGDMVKSVYDPQNRQLPLVSVADPTRISPFRSKLRNGDWRVNQRGAASYSGGGYGFDRWIGFGPGITVNQRPFSPGLLNGVGAQGIDFIVSPGSQYFQRIEDVSSYQGSRVTLTYTVYDGVGGRDLNPTVLQNFGVGGSASVPVIPVAGLGTDGKSINGFKKIQKVYDMPPTAGKILGPGHNVSVYLLNPEVSISGALFMASFDLGDTTLEPNPFVALDYEKEEAACRRFFQWGRINQFFYAQTANEALYMPYPLTPSMRIIPAVGSVHNDPSGPQVNANSSAFGFVARAKDLVTPFVTSSAPGNVSVFNYRFPLDAEL